LKRNSSIILLPFYFKTCRQPITHDHARAASRTAQRDPVYSRMSLNVQPGTFIFHANWWGSGRPHDEAPKLTVQLLLLSACRPCTGTMGQKVHLHFKSQRTRKYSLISCFLPCLCAQVSQSWTPSCRPRPLVRESVVESLTRPWAMLPQGQTRCLNLLRLLQLASLSCLLTQRRPSRRHPPGLRLVHRIFRHPVPLATTLPHLASQRGACTRGRTLEAATSLAT
jgi:hypothetical protein